MQLGLNIFLSKTTNYRQAMIGETLQPSSTKMWFLSISKILTFLMIIGNLLISEMLENIPLYAATLYLRPSVIN